MELLKGCAGLVLGCILLCVVVVGLQTVGCIMRPINEAINVAHEEFGSRAALEKYEWFKDVAAKCEQKLADIRQFQHRGEAMRKQYGDTPFKDWDRKDKEHLAIWDSEVAGVKASYNELAGHYNAAMAKVNWRFANVGDLPAGATVALPREFKPYLED